MKHLLFPLLLLLSTGVMAQVQFGENDYRKPVHFNGNVITFSKPYQPKITGMHIKGIPSPEKINGEKIYSSFMDVDRPARFKNEKSLTTYLFQTIEPELALLPNGSFMLGLLNFVVDKKGRLAYFDFERLIEVSKNVKSFSGAITIPKGQVSIFDIFENILLQIKAQEKGKKATIKPNVSPEFKAASQKVYSKLYAALTKPQMSFSPAKKEGKKVYSSLHVYPLYFNVNNGKVEILEFTNMEASQVQTFNLLH